jgi:hypothetical protein
MKMIVIIGENPSFEKNEFPFKDYLSGADWGRTHIVSPPSIYISGSSNCSSRLAPSIDNVVIGSHPDDFLASFLLTVRNHLA